MLIQTFCAPAGEVADAGLQEISMSRLGRFVALAGKNGAGKSRLLNKLATYISTRNDFLPNFQNALQAIANLKETILNHPSNPAVPQWQREMQQHLAAVERITSRIVARDASQSFKCVRFVPKQLNLADHRQHGNQQLITRFNQAKNPGTDGTHETCLYYIQQLQNRWWNATHQNFPGPQIEKTNAIEDYQRFQVTLKQLLGTDLQRNVDGEATIFEKSIPEAGLSDGQKVILQLAVALHAQEGSLDNSVFILDEPENHLHPAATIDLLQALYEVAGNSQIWIATHSVPLLAYITGIEPMSLWYVEDGKVTHAGRRPERVLRSLLGDDERIGQLNQFSGLPAQLAAINYAMESLLPPAVVAAEDHDPQLEQMRKMIGCLAQEKAVAILDIGAGKGRLLEGIACGAEHLGRAVADLFDYCAFDSSPTDKEICLRALTSHYPSGDSRYFNTPEQFFSCRDDGSIDVAVLCNVLHEIPPHDWLALFSEQSLIMRALKPNGFLLLVEDLRIPVGELAHRLGFLVLDTPHLKSLFQIKAQDVTDGLFISNDYRNDGRLKAHLIGRALLERINSASRTKALQELKETAKREIQKLRDSANLERPSYRQGQDHGFWTQQFANAELFLSQA